MDKHENCKLGVIRNISIVYNRRYFVQCGDVACVGTAISITSMHLRMFDCDMFSMPALAATRKVRNFRYKLLDIKLSDITNLTDKVTEKE